MRIVLLLFVFLSASVVFSQTIDIVTPDGKDDYTIPNEIVKKLRDSRIYQRIGNYTSWNEKKLVEGNLILEIGHHNLDNIIGNNTVILLFKVLKIKDEFILSRLEAFSYTVTGYSNHKEDSADFLHDLILIWADRHTYK